MTTTPKAIRAYLATIGAKGGAAGRGASKAGTQEARSRAANIRWAKYRAQRKNGPNDIITASRKD